MARYKVLKSVARNVAESFTSSLNYVAGDYVMGHLVRLARESGKEELRIDFITRQSTPAELLAAPLEEVPARYIEMFWRLVQAEGSDRSLIGEAELAVHIDSTRRRPEAPGAAHVASPCACAVRITDTRGKLHHFRSEGWWAPWPQQGELLVQSGKRPLTQRLRDYLRRL